MNEDKNKEIIFQEELDGIVERFGKTSQEGAKEALRNTQDLFDCVSVNHQKQIANAFDLKDNVIKTLIKFTPSIKESVVEYEVICCSGPRCAKNGSVEVLKAVKNTLNLDFGETSKDGKVALTTQNCFKRCNLGPNIVVNGKFHHYMTADKAKELMEEIIK